jgi:hypothetical protein
MGRDVEPNPLPPETSQIWMKVLSDLWRQGITQTKIAQQLCIPESELHRLLFGIVSVPGERQSGIPTLRIAQ